MCAAIATPLLGAATDAMGVAGWLKVTGPEIYAHRLRNKPDEPQGGAFLLPGGRLAGVQEFERGSLLWAGTGAALPCPY